MDIGTLIVVGNKFKKFANANKKIITLDEFKAMAQVRLLRNYDVHIGQGVTPKEFFDIKSELSYAKKNTLNLINSEKLESLADEQNVRSAHKHSDDNVMITPPVKLSESNYVSDFLIQDRCAELSDHMTGQHIQGMVLVEAARQMMLAVSEYYLLDQPLIGKSYCVLNDIQIKFKRFAFPLPCEIHYELSDFVKHDDGRIHGVGQARFRQNNTDITEVYITFTNYPEDFISTKEESLAKKAVDDSITEIQSKMVSISDERKRV